MNSDQQFYFNRIKEKMEREHPGAYFKEGAMYINSTTRVPIICEGGSEYGISPTGFISRGTWCKCCRGRLPKTLKDYQALAISKGGKYLLDTIPRAAAVSTNGWQCEFGHEWPACYRDIHHSGTWCPHCDKYKKKTLVDYQQLARDKGFTYILNDIPDDTHDPVTGWRCKAKPPHAFEACYNRIRGGSGCAKCAGCARKTLQDYQALAEAKGGSYQSDSIPTNVITATDGWHCGLHPWKTSYHSVQSGSWCPTCNESRLEREIRLVLVELSVPLDPQLRIPGTLYKFDFGCHNLKVLIEGDGEGHFHSIEFFGGDQGLADTRRRDVIKTQWAMDNGYRLLRIDYKQKLADIRDHLQWFIARKDATIAVTNASLYEHLLDEVTWPSSLLFHYDKN